MFTTLSIVEKICRLVIILKGGNQSVSIDTRTKNNRPMRRRFTSINSVLSLAEWPTRAATCQDVPEAVKATLRFAFARKVLKQTQFHLAVIDTFLFPCHSSHRMKKKRRNRKVHL
jgi:hypothetical protein